MEKLFSLTKRLYYIAFFLGCLALSAYLFINLVYPIAIGPLKPFAEYFSATPFLADIFLSGAVDMYLLTGFIKGRINAGKASLSLNS